MGFELYQSQIAPGFLKGPFGLAWGQALGIVKDFFFDLTKQGIQQRFVGLAQEDAIAAIGAERGIPRGASQTTASYVAELINAWQIWELAGTPWGILGLLNLMGYTTAYVINANGILYGPASGVVIPNPRLGVAGTPPAFSKDSVWNFAIDPNGVRGFQGVGNKVGTWEKATVYPTNQLISPNPANGLLYQITAGGGGSSGTTQPVWPLVVGNTIADGALTWKCVGALLSSPVGQGEGYPDPLGAFWSQWMIILNGAPSSWTNVVNPPTSSSSPSLFEIATINDMVRSLGAAHAAVAGILLVDPLSARACFGWPRGRTYFGDAGIVTGGPFVGSTTRWTPHKAYVVGNVVLPTQGSGRYFYCTGSGTSAYTEPSWPVATGVTFTDGTVTWKSGPPTNNYLFGIGSTVFALPPE